MRKTWFKKLLFLLPMLIIIGIFSMWPIIQSFTYTFFDYQLNDQQKVNIDGANAIQTFFKITLPLLKPSILVALLFRTLDAFRVFDLCVDRGRSWWI